MYYQQRIREILAAIGRIGMDPRHVEAFMRLEHGSLDGLNSAAFENEVRISAGLVDQDPSGAEQLALSYGL
jgi:hypothetical protein